MGIDSIGKKGPPAPPEGQGISGTSRSGETGRAFSVDKAAPAASAGPVEASHTALQRFRAGEVDVKGYVDLKVEEATAHLKLLPAAELERIKANLRDRMASDPALVDLVRTATGKVPPPPTDD